MTKSNNNHNGAKSKTWLLMILLGLVIFGIYHNSLNAPFIHDDNAKIVQNPDIKKLINLKTKLVYPYGKYKTFKRNDPSRPLTYFTFTLNYHFGKLNPFGYHLFNILLHIFNSVLIFLLTKKILFYTYKGKSNLIPILVALLFAVHPVDTNVVTYTFARSGALATLFYLLSLLLFIKTFEGKKRIYIFSVFCCLLAFASKPIAVTLPAMVLIFDYIFLSEYEIKKVFKKKYYHIPFWAILAAYLLFRYFYLGGLGDVESEAPLKVSKYAYLLTQTNILLRYIKSLLIPAGLSIDYAIKLSKTIFEFRVVYSIFLIAGILFATWRIYKKKTNRSKIILFCILWFFITLSPTSTFFPTTSYMDDKRLYLSGFGFYLAFVFAYFLAFGRAITYSKKLKQILLCTIAIYISILAVTTYKRNQLYQNPVLLWQDAITKYPDSIKGHQSLGLLYKKQKKYEKAYEEFLKTLELNPNYAKGHSSLGNLYYEQKRYDKAFQHYHKALEINPDYAEVHNNLGALYNELGKYKRAIQQYKRVVDIRPNYADVHNNLGVSYYQLGEYNKARKEYEKALDLNPDYADAHNNLGVVYNELKEYDKAIQEYQKALEINADYAWAHNNLGNLYKELKKYKKAIQEYQKVLEINPDYAGAHNNLGLLYDQLGQYEKAIQEYQNAIRIDPNYEKAHYNLGVLYYEQGKYEKSLKEFRFLLTSSSNDKFLRERVKKILRDLKAQMK